MHFSRILFCLFFELRYLCSQIKENDRIWQHITSKPFGTTTYRVGGGKGVYVLAGIIILNLYKTFLTIVGKVCFLWTCACTSWL